MVQVGCTTPFGRVNIITWLLLLLFIIIIIIIIIIVIIIIIIIVIVAENKTCHPQCDSLTSCWGPNDDQCAGCRYYSFRRRCVQNCTNEVTGLTEADAGVYQNESIGVCEPCHAQCVGGCINGTVSGGCVVWSSLAEGN